ncbi:MAG: hypothetical protein ACMUIP_02530 [bacterium]
MKIKRVSDFEVNNVPIVVTIDKIFNFLNGKDDYDIVMFSFHLASEMVHLNNAYDYRTQLDRNLETHDVYKLLNSYGYGVCKQCSMLMGFILDIFSIKHTILYLGKLTQNSFDHFALEVFYDQKWHYFDPNLGVCFLNDTHVASIKEIKEKKFTKIVGDFSADTWIKNTPEVSYLRDIKKFQELYFTLFDSIEIFTLYDQRFPYKKEMMDKKGIVKWYDYNQKEYFIPEASSVKLDKTGWGIVDGVRIQSNENYSFYNLIFSIPYNAPLLEINSFPFLILDCAVEFENHVLHDTITLVINGQEYHPSISCGKFFFHDLLHDNLFEKPIYSLLVQANYTISHYFITAQTTPLVQKVYIMMEKTK